MFRNTEILQGIDKNLGRNFPHAFIPMTTSDHGHTKGPDQVPSNDNAAVTSFTSRQPRPKTVKTKMKNSDALQSRKKVSRISQVAEVYAELSEALGDEIPTSELLSAAESLIRISKGEYTDKVLVERKQNPNYYTHAIDKALEEHQWNILSMETRNMDTGETFEQSEPSIFTYRSINTANGFLEL